MITADQIFDVFEIPEHLREPIKAAGAARAKYRAAVKRNETVYLKWVEEFCRRLGHRPLQ